MPSATIGGINPDYGTMDDFSALLDAAHSHKLKVIIDVVFSHTSPDSLLSKVHPEWFWKNTEGGNGNRIGEWSDVVDLDYSAPDLWDYQIETLKGWLMEGVDGFRCDVAPLIPLSFWIEARDACAAVNPETIWLAETVEGDFINTVRRAGFICLTDTETLRAFDMSYEYDTYPDWKKLLNGGIDLSAYINRLRTQESILCDSDLKLRFLENHDQPRAAELVDDERRLRNWTAYSLFAKGTALLYAGQEYAMKHKPDLFNPDPIDWSASESEVGRKHVEYVAKLIAVKKDGIMRDGFYWLPEAPEGIIAAAYERRRPDGRLIGLRLGLFNVEGDSTVMFDITAIWSEITENTEITSLFTGELLRLKDGRLEFGLDAEILDWGLTD
jgi:glycosidase